MLLYLCRREKIIHNVNLIALKLFRNCCARIQDIDISNSISEITNLVLERNN